MKPVRLSIVVAVCSAIITFINVWQGHKLSGSALSLVAADLEARRPTPPELAPSENRARAYGPSASKAFDVELQAAVGKYVSKSGDTMSGSLHITNQAGSSPFGPGLWVTPLSTDTYGIQIDRTGSDQGLCLARNVSTGACTAPLTYSGGSYVNVGGSLGVLTQAQFYTSNTSFPGFYAAGGGGYQDLGVITASLGTCGAGVGNAEGGWRYDSTTKTFKWCNGTAWTAVGTGAGTVATDVVSAFFQCDQTTGPGGGCPENDNTAANQFKGAWTSTSVDLSTSRFTCTWDTPGTGGATGVVVAMADNSALATDLCSCTLGACNTGANVAMLCNCAGGTLTGGSTLRVRLKSTTDCANNPVNIRCSPTLFKSN